MNKQKKVLKKYIFLLINVEQVNNLKITLFILKIDLDLHVHLCIKPDVARIDSTTSRPEHPNIRLQGVIWGSTTLESYLSSPNLGSSCVVVIVDSYKDIE